MTHAINRDTIVDNLIKGNADVIAGPYSPASPYYNQDLEPLAYDPEKAKEYEALQSNVVTAAKRGYVDLIIEPADTRKYLVAAFEMLFTKRMDTPYKKHGTK